MDLVVGCPTMTSSGFVAMDVWFKSVPLSAVADGSSILFFLFLIVHFLFTQLGLNNDWWLWALPWPIATLLLGGDGDALLSAIMRDGSLLSVPIDG